MEKNIFSKSNLLLMAAGLLINMLMVYLVNLTGLPIYVDSVGTILTALLGGILPGITVGFFSNMLNYLFSISHDPLTLYYGLISILLAIAAVYLANKGLFQKITVTIKSVFVLAVIGGGLGSVLTWILYGFQFGDNISSSFVMSIYDTLHCSPFFAQLLGDYVVDLFDKSVTLFAAWLILRAVPDPILKKFDYGYKYLKTKQDPPVDEIAISCRKVSLRHKLALMMTGAAILLGISAISICLYILNEKDPPSIESSFIQIFSLLFGIGILVVGYVFVFYEQNILKPVRILIKQTQEAGKDLAEGERLRDHLQVKTGDEMEILFDKMCEAEDRIVSSDHASQSKTAFLSKLSHEIRTPLNSIIGFSNLAVNERKTISQEELLDYMQKIQLSGNYLLELVSDVLDISRIEEGRMTICNEACRLDDLIEEVVNSFQGQMKSKNIEFVLDKDVNDVLLYMDNFHTTQILNNLISNACKYTEEGGTVGLEVHTKLLSQKKMQVQFIVQDTGIGMSEEFQKKIFEPFTQDKRGMKMKNQLRGSGLGMSICKNLVDLLGGTIELESQEGEGSCFTVTIPYELIGKARAEDLQQNMDFSLLKGKKILVVDDLEMNRIVVEKTLSVYGLEFEDAEDGRQAVEKFGNAKEGEYLTIFMDVNMPEMDGLEATRIIRKMERSDHDIPIVGMTADAFSTDIQKTKESGMNYHVTKPIQVNKLLNVLMEIVQK